MSRGIAVVCLIPKTLLPCTVRCSECDGIWLLESGSPVKNTPGPQKPPLLHLGFHMISPSQRHHKYPVLLFPGLWTNFSCKLSSWRGSHRTVLVVFLCSPPWGPKGHFSFNEKGHLELQFTWFTLITKFPVRVPPYNSIPIFLTNRSLWDLLYQIINSSVSSTVFPSPNPSCFCNCSVHRDNSFFCHFLCSNSSLLHSHFLFFVFLIMTCYFQTHFQHLAYYSLFFPILQFPSHAVYSVPLSLLQLDQFFNTQSSKSLGEDLIPCQ